MKLRATIVFDVGDELHSDKDLNDFATGIFNDLATEIFSEGWDHIGITGLEINSVKCENVTAHNTVSGITDVDQITPLDRRTFYVKHLGDQIEVALIDDVTLLEQCLVIGINKKTKKLYAKLINK